MKTLFLPLLTSLCLNLGANLYEDKETGLSIEIPENLSENWQINHTRTGSKIHVYHSDNIFEQFYVLVLGKFSSEIFASKDIDAFVLSEVGLVFGDDELFEDEDFSFEFVLEGNEEKYGLPIQTIRYRFSDEEEVCILFDVHFLKQGESNIVMIAATHPFADETLLDAFSESILESISHPN